MKIKKIAVGSANLTKINAVKELFQEWSLDFEEVKGFDVTSGISDQPLTLEETIQGAKNRAIQALKKIDEPFGVGIGIESGLMKAPGTETGYLEATICCFYDGTHLSTGMSCGFEVPPAVLSEVLDNGLDLSHACYKQNIGGEKGLGAREGLVGLVTKGHIDRKKYTKQAVAMALGQWFHPEWYRNQA